MTEGYKMGRHAEEMHDGDMMEDEDDGKKPTPTFLLKTYQMVNDRDTDNLVCWNEKGDGFVVKNEHEFAKNVLPKHFRHKNFASFVRQLNFYGFKKRTSHSCSYFTHPLFRRGDIDKLKLIRRKTTENTSNVKDAISSLQSQVTELREQYDHIWKMQHQILFILSQFVRRTPQELIQGASLLNSRPLKRQRLGGQPAAFSLEYNTSSQGSSSMSGSGGLNGEPPLSPGGPQGAWIDADQLGKIQDMVDQMPLPATFAAMPPPPRSSAVVTLEDADESEDDASVAAANAKAARTPTRGKGRGAAASSATSSAMNASSGGLVDSSTAAASSSSSSSSSRKRSRPAESHSDELNPHANAFTSSVLSSLTSPPRGSSATLTPLTPSGTSSAIPLPAPSPSTNWYGNNGLNSPLPNGNAFDFPTLATDFSHPGTAPPPSPLLYARSSSDALDPQLGLAVNAPVGSQGLVAPTGPGGSVDSGDTSPLFSPIPLTRGITGEDSYFLNADAVAPSTKPNYYASTHKPDEGTFDGV